jgi:hypothetical protein
MKLELVLLNRLKDAAPTHVYDPLHLTEQSPIPRRRQTSGQKIYPNSNYFITVL